MNKELFVRYSYMKHQGNNILTKEEDSIILLVVGSSKETVENFEKEMYSNGIGEIEIINVSLI